MNVVFRTDASLTIGSGHVMRCLTLADVLRHRGANAAFVCREHVGHLCERIEAQGFTVIRLPGRHSHPPLAASSPRTAWLGVDCHEDAEETRSIIDSFREQPDWLIADHYAIDHRWEQSLRPSVARLMVIDDLADRRHDCDLLLDQNYYSDAAGRYDDLIPSGSGRMLGPAYALLRPEFEVARRSVGRAAAPRLFASVGGADPLGVCAVVAAALKLLGSRAPGADLVVGGGDHALPQSNACLHDTQVHGFVENIATLMARCSLAVGAGGSSTWERCALGLPSLVVIVAEHQRRMVEDLAGAGVIVNLGRAVDLGVEALASAIAALLDDGSRRARLREAGLELVDCGGSQRVAAEMRRLSICSV